MFKSFCSLHETHTHHLTLRSRALSCMNCLVSCDTLTLPYIQYLPFGSLSTTTTISNYRPQREKCFFFYSLWWLFFCLCLFLCFGLRLNWHPFAYLFVSMQIWIHSHLRTPLFCCLAQLNTTHILNLSLLTVLLLPSTNNALNHKGRVMENLFSVRITHLLPSNPSHESCQRRLVARLFLRPLFFLFSHIFSRRYSSFLLGASLPHGKLGKLLGDFHI